MSQTTEEYKEFRKSFSYQQEISLKTVKGFWSLKMIAGYILILILQAYFIFWFPNEAPANLWVYMIYFLAWVIQYWVFLMFLGYNFALLVTVYYAYEIDKRAKLEFLGMGKVVFKKKKFPNNTDTKTTKLE